MPQPLHRPEDPMAAHLTALYDRVARLERRKQGGSFDPNEDPVIIGLGASAGNSSTPDAVSAGVSGSVILGRFASASDTAPVIAIGDGAAAPGGVGFASSATAIGNSATASGPNAIAIGDVATASIQDAIAIGDNASAAGNASVAIGALASTNSTSGNYAIAIGDSATATVDKAIAVGYGTSAKHANATAVGAGATTTAAHQIMLGTSAETVIPRGNFDASHLPTSNPGVAGLVWNNSGVLAVS